MPKSSCSVAICDRDAWKRGLCQAHYHRWLRHGDVRAEVPLRRYGDPWRYVNKNGPVPEHCPDLGPCWLWTGQQDTKGYGRMTRDRRKVKAHRLIYELLIGPIPGGLTLDHLCRVRHCVNPAHLEPVTVGENVRRGEAGRTKASHCVKGHPLDAANTYVFPNGKRRCLACKRAVERSRDRRKAKATG